MGKSKAEIQRAYRQRLKEKNNEEYLRRERERMRRNYVPSSELSDRDKKRRNEQNRAKLRRFYQRKREERQRLVAPQEQDTSGYDSAPNDSSERGRLRVRIPFQNNRRKGALIRWKRELSEATSRIRLLEQERSKLLKRYKSTQRSLQRMKNKSKNQHLSQELTPRKQTEQEMQMANLSNSQKQKIRKSLLLGNVIVSEVKRTKEQTPKGTMKANAALSVKLLRKEGIDVSANPERATENFPTKDDLEKSLPESIVWSQWKRIEIEEKGKKKMVTRVTETKVNREQFLVKLEQQMKDFESHVKRVAKQYEEIKRLKQNLPKHEMLLQLDFAENYSCRSLEEV
ncbi:trichohyalin-like [Ruditapes philippinarum]|uniref:trichohyalin-like n=1 Tax=Ruditapes philippinarum TaxID=129788 RepID=UPI00295BAC3E|nr:trichohyalin-like [Ruditapes philippinarum]